VADGFTLDAVALKFSDFYNVRVYANIMYIPELKICYSRCEQIAPIEILRKAACCLPFHPEQYFENDKRG